MKVIIDTNILISAALCGRNPALIINFIIQSPQYEWIASKAIFNEYLEVLNRPRIKLTDEQRKRWLNLIKYSTKIIDVNINYDFPRDQKDAKFLACAIASNADFLITGDRDFEEIQLINNTLIISVSQFKDLVMI